MSSAFTRAKWTAAAAALASLTAMLLYPGGTPRDHTTIGYKITGNFLSDLGMTVAYDGQANRPGAALFIASIGLLIVGMGGALAGFVRHYATNPAGRRFAYAAAVAGAIDCACFIGVALTPENREMSLHVAFTLAGFRVLPLVALFLTLAARATPTAPPHSITAWSALTLMLVAYVAMLQGGTWTATAAGFAALVIAQKVVTVVTLTVVVWQCHAATRTMPTPPPVLRPGHLT